MERHRAALAKALGRAVTVEGVSDLCAEGRKFSGNSQRRLRQALIFHGTFLLNFELGRIEEFLAMPSRQPEHRRDRSHAEFLTNAGVSAEIIKRALREAWGANQRLGESPEYEALVKTKYATDGWNLRF